MPKLKPGGNHKVSTWGRKTYSCVPQARWYKCKYGHPIRVGDYVEYRGRYLKVLKLSWKGTWRAWYTHGSYVRSVFLLDPATKQGYRHVLVDYVTAMPHVHPHWHTPDSKGGPIELAT